MRIKRFKPKAVKASSKSVIRRRNIQADEEIMDDVVDEAPVEEEVVDDVDVEEAPVEVAPEATDLLFEAEDVAELVAEVTGEEVAVTVDEDSVQFEVGEDIYTVEPEGDEEVLESTRKPLKGKKSVKASKVIRRRPAPKTARKR